MVKIAIIGASGKMGREVAKLCAPVSLKECDVAIDFSAPEALEKILPQLLAQKTPLVSGTTGLPAGFFDEAAKEIPILHAANFSLGIALLKQMIEKAAPYVSESAIYEVHHTEKKDSPSGTALDLQKIVPEASINAERIPDVIGIHTVSLMLGSETLELTHRADDRQLFAKGALKAALWLFGKPPGRYTLAEVL